MTRNRGKKALYEVMSTARSKSSFGSPGDSLRRTEDRDQTAEDKSPTSDHGPSSSDFGSAKWRRKPRIVQLNAGRIEFSMPYQIAVAAALVLVFVLLASYRLGQFAGRNVPQGPSAAQGSLAETPEVTRTVSDIPTPPVPAQRTPEPQRARPVTPVGDNVIVLVQYHTMADLEPVRAHFAAHDIETEIVLENGRYLLQTKQRYISTTAPGGDGYKAIEKIKEVGALYKGKAPPGYEPFAPHYFSDAYGKKVK